MAIHSLHATQVIRASAGAAWDFFSNPRNLPRITPPALAFQVLSEVPERMHPGLMIQYRVRPLFGVPMTWLTEITHVREGEYFVDEQRVGPYAIWHHEHHFKDLGDGRTEMRDLVTYVPPFGVLGELVHPFLIGPKIEEIFAYRRKVVETLFP